MIDDLQDMSKTVLTMYMRYRQRVEHKADSARAPKRIIFYRGVLSFRRL